MRITLVHRSSRSRWRWIVAGLTLVIGAASTGACSDGQSASPASPDASGERVDGGECCPPDPNPGCCMGYGGWSNGRSCGPSCDGMPVPTDPSWKLETDDHGCRVWKNPNDFWHGGTRNAATSYCGEMVVPDGGRDASDAAPE